MVATEPCWECEPLADDHVALGCHKQRATGTVPTGRACSIRYRELRLAASSDMRRKVEVRAEERRRAQTKRRLPSIWVHARVSDEQGTRAYVNRKRTCVSIAWSWILAPIPSPKPLISLCPRGFVQRKF